MKPSAPSKVSWDQQLVSMPYTLLPSPSLSSTSPVILVSEPLSSFEARRFASPESCLGDSDLCSHAEVLVCSRHGPASRPRGQPGPHVSLGWMCSLFGGREHAGHSRTKPQAQRLVAAPSSLLPGAQGPSAGIGCVRPGRWACVWGAFPSPSGEAVLFLKTSLSVCLAQNVSGAPG